jgi:OmpA-OmpF porin, OOP family
MRPTLIVVALLLPIAPAVASAQAGGDIDLQAFHPAMDSRGYVTVNASQVLGPREVSFGLVTTWGRNLLRFTSGDNTYEVQNIITPTLVGAYGFHLGKAELELGAALPFAIMSGDRAPDSNNGTPANPNDDQSYRFDGQGLGDAALHLKWRARSTSRPPGLGLALIGSVRLPTATKGSWLGDDAVEPELLGVVDYELGRFKTAVNAGVRWRTTDGRFVDDQAMTMTGTVPLTGGVIQAGSVLPFGVAAAYSVVPETFDAVAELYGAAPVGGQDFFPLEALGGLKLYLAKNSFLSFGAGSGLLRGKGANPDLRAFVGIVFEPNVGDRDGDGLKDDIDGCPNDPEDKDGFEDEDGCPDPDNDRDGIPDEKDACPDDPEDKDGFQDEDGCPDVEKLDRDGDGILDAVDGCPDDPEDKDGFQDRDGCPDPDNDRDGILDVDDLCPNDPEDRDGFEDTDGCPDPDNDHDLILDKDDHCPRIDGQTAKQTAEVYNQVDDEDGCPDRGRVIDMITKIDILDKVYFEFDSAVIQERSYGILTAVAKTIITSPDIQLVEVQGHTDERGSDEYNRDLSQRRSESVREFLIKAGVAADRLTAQGYGESQPLDHHHSEEAWATNRRVEFIILKRTHD